MHPLCSIPWFCGHDIWIDSFSALTLFLIAFFSFKYYKLEQKKKELWLAVAFFLIGIAFIFNILTNFTFYTHVLETEHFGELTIVEHHYQVSYLLNTIGYLVYMILTLAGLYVLFAIRCNNSKATHFMFMIFILLLAFFTMPSYHVFHFVALLFLIFITNQYHDAYLKSKNKNTKLLCFSFGTIAFSQILFVCVTLFNPLSFVVASIVQLIGYFLLLMTFIRIIYHGKKKK